MPAPGVVLGLAAVSAAQTVTAALLATSDGALIVITALGSIAPIIAAVASIKAARGVSAVHAEVRTMNELSIGQLGEAAETRRIAGVSPDNRTPREARHIAAARDAPPGYAPTPDEPTPPHDPPAPEKGDK